MRWFRDMRTSSKIIAVVLLMALFLGCVGFSGYFFNMKANNNEKLLYYNYSMAIQTAEKAQIDNRAAQGVTYKIFLAPTDEKQREALKKELADRESMFDQDLIDYEKTPLDEFEKETLKKFTEELQIYRAELKKALDLAATGDQLAGYNYFISQAEPHMNAQSMLLKDLIVYNTDAAVKHIEQSQSDFERAVMIMVILSMIGVVLGLSLAIIVARTIAKPLTRVVSALQEIAKGNLSVEEVSIQSQDEIGELSKALKTMLVKLRELVKQVAESSEHVAASAEELTASAEQQAAAANQAATAITAMASGAEKQSDSVKMTSEIIEQMSNSIQQVATNSSEVTEQTNQTLVVAQQGRKTVEKVVAQMDNIGKGTEQVQESIEELALSSKHIGEISNVISGIANQTNLLALNAAIEAARAGEQGRGFAVVAEEVRKLAEQSLEASKQITNLINDNQVNIDRAVSSFDVAANDVKVGINIVATADGAFQEIAESINSVSSQIQEITTTIEDMAVGSQQIVLSMNEIDLVSNENRDQAQMISAVSEEQIASTDQIASSSQDLAKMSQELRHTLEKFRY